ncbi:hypothetical protein NM688_g4652 [Phlebia brevispora]|uniref:Uncharacterized protein n=1 Tax=Phlebia brevispora TaxID=194682 RepID=A0ACC1T2G7_9APHY|nr:hypothetical protein NM688_g4652 [Phlebia brevispora]
MGASHAQHMDRGDGVKDVANSESADESITGNCRRVKPAYGRGMVTVPSPRPSYLQRVHAALAAAQTYFTALKFAFALPFFNAQK